MAWRGGSRVVPEPQEYIVPGDPLSPDTGRCLPPSDGKSLESKGPCLTYSLLCHQSLAFEVTCEHL